jgi:hypothetical protein
MNLEADAMRSSLDEETMNLFARSTTLSSEMESPTSASKKILSVANFFPKFHPTLSMLDPSETALGSKSEGLYLLSCAVFRF